MVGAMGCIVTAIPEDMEREEYKCFSHWAIIHTDWGLCKLLIPKNLNADVVVKVSFLGTAKAEEIVFKGERTADAKAFVESVEARLNRVMLRHTEIELMHHIAEGGRIH